MVPNFQHLYRQTVGVLLCLFLYGCNSSDSATTSSVEPSAVTFSTPSPQTSDFGPSMAGMTFEESDETKAEKKAMKRLQKQLPLELRKQIYYETYEAANKAYADLEREYPTESAPPKGEKEFRDWGIRQLEYRKQQDIKHKAEVAKKHGLTHTELEGVKYEGDLAQWPYPE